jgi:hypothetical protein
MISKKSLIILSLIAVMLNACGAEATATPSQEEIMNQVYTVVAMTNAVTATSIPQPTSTAAFMPTVTLISILPTATLFQGIVNPTSVSSCDSSVYLSDVTIPDGTTMSPDEEFTKTWSLQNTGTCTWTTSYSMIYYSGNSMSGSATALPSAVSPGGSIEVSVDLAAPSSAGTYTGYWRLQNASGVTFGEAVYVQIVVSGSTATPTPTSTSDEDEAYTSTPTTEPTYTPTPTPVIESTSEAEDSSS